MHTYCSFFCGFVSSFYYQSKIKSMLVVKCIHFKKKAKCFITFPYYNLYLLLFLLKSCREPMIMMNQILKLAYHSFVFNAAFREWFPFKKLNKICPRIYIASISKALQPLFVIAYVHNFVNILCVQVVQNCHIHSLFKDICFLSS